jgi:transcriptional regulator of acetoin/glycerol metabolism
LSGDVVLLRRAREQFLETGEEPRGVIRPVIALSWRRSLASGLRADRLDLPYEPDAERDGRLYSAARPVLDRLGEELEGTPTSAILADRRGCIVERWVGDAELRTALDRNLSVPGYSVREDVAGTNGLGTAMESGVPILVSGAEHFADIYQPLSCAGAPIRHPVTRQIEGVIDITCPVDETNSLLLPFVAKAAAEIERRLYLQSSGRERMLLEVFMEASRRSSSPVVSLNEQVVIASPGAARLLGGVDQAVLWEQTAATLRSGGQCSWELPLADGRPAVVHCRPVDGGDQLLGAVLEIDVMSEPRVTGSIHRFSRTGLAGLAGRSGAWQEVVRCAKNAASGQGPVLVAGESGVGKLAVARAIGEMIGGDLTVFDAATVVVDGPGPWLGRVRSRLASGGGTVVVRHIEALEAGLARGLAAVIDEVGSSSGACLVGTLTTEADDRVAGPLVDRFSTFTIIVPPLRERTADIPDLVELLSRRHGTGRQSWRSEALQALTRLEWRGNVRALENVVRRVLAERRAGEIAVSDLPADVMRGATRRVLTPIEQAELDALVSALRRANGNKMEAAQFLGIARSTLYRKLRDYGLDLDRVAD